MNMARLCRALILLAAIASLAGCASTRDNADGQFQRQVKRAKGFVIGGLLPDSERTFWTMTVWENRAAMLAFMTSGAHKQAMPKLLDWCDEASVAGWEQEDSALPA